MRSEFSEITDNWNVGDTLFFHSLTPSQEKEAKLADAIKENGVYSPTRQAEALLKKWSTAPSFAFDKNPSAFLSLQRIA